MSGTPRYCSKCGALVPEGAAFCPKCGSPVASTPVPTAGPSPPREYHYEKQEKGEKHEKGEKAEKGRGGDLAGVLTGGLILIWLGITFYYAQTGTIGWDVWWAYFLLGLGIILILQGLVRYTQNRRSYSGPIIGGAILALIGSAFIKGLNTNLWPLLLVVIGIVVIVSGLSGRRRSPTP